MNFHGQYLFLKGWHLAVSYSNIRLYYGGQCRSISNGLGWTFFFLIGWFSIFLDWTNLFRPKEKSSKTPVSPQVVALVDSTFGS